MMSNNMITNFDNDIDDDINVHYNSANGPTRNIDSNKILQGTVRNRKTKFGSF